MRRTTAALIAALLITFGLGPPGASAYSNGHLPLTALSPIASGVKCEAPAGQLSNEAAAAYNTMALAAGQRLATNGCDSAYRSYERQVYYWALYIQGVGNLAAHPGTSNHGWGTAGDESTWVQGYLKLHGERFCWRKIEAFSEPWHWNYLPGCFHRPNPGTNLHSPILRQHSGGPGQGIFVRKVQKLLRGHGDKTVTVDGDFGWQTRKAVEGFQKAERIKVNGVVSPRVWKHLRRPVLNPVKTTPKTTPAPTQAPPPKQGRKPHRKPKGPAWGIDVSNNNGSVNWTQVRHAGASFAVVKATEGQDYIDPTFTRARLRSITAAHLVPGVYHYLRPRSDRVGAREASWFVQVIGNAGYGKGFLPPVLDVEETTLSPTETCRYVGSFLRAVRKSLGVKAIVYTFPGFAAANFDGCSWLGKYRLWIANIGVSSPSVPAPWSEHLIWQYTWSAHVAGVSGGVDADKLVGGKAALANLRVGKPPRRVRLAPRAKLELPLEAEPKWLLREKAATTPLAGAHVGGE